MGGRTYRFIEEKPLYPFGYGLSYTSFAYTDARIVRADENTVELAVEVANTGAYAAKEKVQCYARFTDSRTVTPRLQLCSLACVELAPGETKTVTLTADRYWLKAVLEDGTRAEPDGAILLYIGGGQPGADAEWLRCASQL